MSGRAELLHSDRSASTAKRRRIETLAAEVDRILETDRRFFQRRPERHHRVRHASRAEMELAHEVTGQDFSVPGGFRYFVAVRQKVPGARVRLFVLGLAYSSTDLNERTACAIFDNTFRRTGAVIRVADHEAAREGGEA